MLVFFGWKWQAMLWRHDRGEVGWEPAHKGLVRPHQELNHVLAHASHVLRAVQSVLVEIAIRKTRARIWPEVLHEGGVDLSLVYKLRRVEIMKVTQSPSLPAIGPCHMSKKSIMFLAVRYNVRLAEEELTRCAG